MQFVIVDYRSYFFFHAVFLLARSIMPAGMPVGLKISSFFDVASK